MLWFRFVKKQIIKFTEIIGKGKRPFLKLFIGIDKLAEDENTINWWIIDRGGYHIFTKYFIMRINLVKNIIFHSFVQRGGSSDRLDY